MSTTPTPAALRALTIPPDPSVAPDLGCALFFPDARSPINWPPPGFMRTAPTARHRRNVVASTTPAPTRNALPIEGLSYVVQNGKKAFTAGRCRRLEGQLIGRRCGSYSAWPFYSKFFDNLGRSRTTCTRNDEQAAKVGQQGKPESYYFSAATE